ncbi:MAG UNVERIFIED_CONTAM: multicopper oxidase domain-containing protein [Planctomycetaceae bacterium]|jgi:FtsP/CotA-like multicopper oxidase with cupredoxin domain
MDAHPIHPADRSPSEVARSDPRWRNGQYGRYEQYRCLHYPHDSSGTARNGRKDTVVCYPGDITIIKALFDIKGNYVWHCHILDHEDNEMMRPLTVI